MESFINSDLNAFQCEAGMEEAMQVYDLLYKDRSIIAPRTVWGIGGSYKEIAAYHSEKSMETQIGML